MLKTSSTIFCLQWVTWEGSSGERQRSNDATRLASDWQ
jgi:hypothetical protein